MKLTDEQIKDKLSYLLLGIYEEGRITEKELQRIVFYGLYNNEWFGRNDIYDIDEECCII